MRTHKLALISLVAILAIACRGEPETWTALSTPLDATDPIEVTFFAQRSGRHQVILEFAWPIADRQVEELATLAAATAGSANAPTFDFSWQLSRDGVVIAKRDAPQPSTGVVETRTSDLGEGRIRSLGLVYGDCDLEASRPYTLRFVPGGMFAGIVQVAPRIVVSYAPYVIRSR